MRRIGKGMLTTSGEGFTGSLRVITGLKDVLGLAGQGDLSDVIVFTPAGDVSALSPILARIKGVICATGGPNTHIAIMARAFDIHCLMRTEASELPGLHGQALSVNSNGEVFTDAAESPKGG